MASERRRKQVARRIQQRISEVLLFEVKDPRAAFFTITGVEMNQDLSVARILWSVLGGQGDRAKVESFLAHAHGFLRTEVARAIQLRTAPELVFEYDEGLERADRNGRSLRKVLPEDDGAPPAGPGGE